MILTIFGHASKNPFARSLPYQGMKCGNDVKNDELCELMPYSAMSDTCIAILTVENQSQAQQKEDVLLEQVK